MSNDIKIANEYYDHSVISKRSYDTTEASLKLKPSHAAQVDFGLSAGTAEEWARMRVVIAVIAVIADIVDIVDHTEERATGAWHGQSELLTFHIKGADVVIAKEKNEFVIVLKGEVEMQGLRKREDNKFERFFAQAQTEAARSNCVFFLDCGEGRDFTTSTMDGEDLSGWLIPQNLAQEFERQFLEGAVGEKWSEFITFAI